jgi:2-aminobenzoate-CoA ligase
MGMIPAEYVPPENFRPTRLYTLSEFQEYPELLNATEELLDKQVAAGRGGRVAVYFEDQHITYTQLLSSVNRLGSAFRALGIEEFDRVVIRSPNIPPAVVSNFAILKIGAVSVPTSPLFSQREIVHICNNSEAKAVLCAFPLLEELEKAKDQLQTVRHIIVVGGNPDEVKAKGFLSYGELMAKAGDTLEPVHHHRHDVAVLLYTSGTTGPPKGTVHLMDELLCIADSFGKYAWRITEGDIVGGPAPLSLAAGYGTVAVIPYRFGAAASLLPRFTPEGMFETIQKHRMTVVSILPTAYRKMLQVPDAERIYDLDSVRLFTGGGESLTAETYRQWKNRFGADIYEGLGTTEMFFVFVSNAVTMRTKPGSVGVAVPGYEVNVISDEGRVCQRGEIGRLVARGPTGTLYWRDVERQKRAVVDGWCFVGDYVQQDEDGYLWFVSREEDLIKSSGYRIGPEEIEEVLIKHPVVADSGVIGVPDPVRGESTKAFVVLKEGVESSEVLKEELIEYCRNYIAVYKLPREIEFTDQLPRTVTGKLLRRILRERERKGNVVKEETSSPGRSR